MIGLPATLAGNPHGGLIMALKEEFRQARYSEQNGQNGVGDEHDNLLHNSLPLNGVNEQYGESMTHEEQMSSAIETGAIYEGAWCGQRSCDTDDPGEEMVVGEHGRTTLEMMPYLERVISEENFLPVHFLEEGAVVQRAVGRIVLKRPHRGLPARSGWGTGFLISPSLLLTNNHVIETKRFASHTVDVQFNYQLDHNGMAQSVDTYQLDPDDLFITNVALDYTLVRVKSKLRFSPIFLPPTFPFVDDTEVDSQLTHPIFQMIKAGERWGQVTLATDPEYAVEQRVSIVQHPQGRRKEVAMHSNQIERIHRNVVRYTTDTEPGSSGSPVFNSQWDVIALHHAGGERGDNGRWINNQGVRIDQIQQDMARQLVGRDDVLAELHLLDVV